jgi:hypothetical protein
MNGRRLIWVPLSAVGEFGTVLREGLVVPLTVLAFDDAATAMVWSSNERTNQRMDGCSYAALVEMKDNALVEVFQEKYINFETQEDFRDRSYYAWTYSLWCLVK